MTPVPAASHSARASVLTLFAQFVRPAQRAVSTRQVVQLLAPAGLDEANVRRTLTRLGDTALLGSRRVGRETVWDLTEDGRELARVRDAQIFGAQGLEEWDGRWSVVVASVPDHRRNERYALRSRLAWAGFGQLRSGLWVSPYAGHEAEAVAVLEQLDLAATAHTFVATTGALSSGPDLVGEAWDLAGLTTAYEAFVDTQAAVHPHGERECFVADLQLITAWVGLAHGDPHLPRELLPTGWPGERAATDLAQRHGAWSGPATDWFSQIVGGPTATH